MGLSGNFNPSQTVLVPGAKIDVFAVPSPTSGPSRSAAASAACS